MSLDQLVALHTAAEDCFIESQQIIEEYSEVPEDCCEDFGIDAWGNWQRAKSQLGWIEVRANHLRGLIASWWAADPDGIAIDHVRQAVGFLRPPICIGSHSYATAHDAALGLAEAVLEVINDCRPSDKPAAALDVIADRLKALRWPDLEGLIVQEYHAAAQFVPIVEDEVAPDSDSTSKSEPNQATLRFDDGADDSQELRVFGVN